MAGTFTPLQTGNSRVFLIEGGARIDHRPSYEHQLKQMETEQSFGDVENVYSPSPKTFGKFDVVGTIRGEEERPTTSLMGRYAQDLRSLLLELAKRGCANDLQLNMGQCTDPSLFNEFSKKLIMETVNIPTWSSDPMGALQPDEKVMVNETAEISGVRLYEVLPIAIAERAGNVLTNEAIDAVICDAISCGDCEELSDGCQKMFTVTLSAGGSPGTPADVVFSIDGGVTFYAHDVDSLAAGEDPSGIACVSGYVVVISQESCSHHYADKDDFDGVTDPAFTEVTTGYSASGCPNDIWSLGNFAFIVGENGYVYSLQDPAGGVTTVDAGVATVDDLLAVHALSEEFAVAVGDNGVVIFTENGTLWQAATTRPVGIAINLNCVWAKSETEWIVGTSNGRLYYTLNKGKTWTEKSFPGSATGVVFDITFATQSVGFMAHQTAATKGRILRTYDGGFSWIIAPEGGTIPASDKINALAACEFDPNLVLGAGLADDAADGIILVGSD